MNPTPNAVYRSRMYGQTTPWETKRDRMREVVLGTLEIPPHTLEKICRKSSAREGREEKKRGLGKGVAPPSQRYLSLFLQHWKRGSLIPNLAREGALFSALYQNVDGVDAEHVGKRRVPERLVLCWLCFLADERHDVGERQPSIVD